MHDCGFFSHLILSKIPLWFSLSEGPPIFFPLYKNKDHHSDHPEVKDLFLGGYGERKRSLLKHMFLFILYF